MNEDNKIVGIGYNGMPNGCSDDELPWQREAPSKLDTKYPYGMFSLHAHVSLTTSTVLNMYGKIYFVRVHHVLCMYELSQLLLVVRYNLLQSSVIFTCTLYPV